MPARPPGSLAVSQTSASALIRPFARLALLFAVVAAAGCDSVDPLTPITCDDAPLTYEDIGPTGGQEANQGSVVTIRYVGRLASGAVFDSTGVDINGNPQAATFALSGTVPGFRLGIGGTGAFPEAQIPEIPPMRLGGRRTITIPPNLGYGGVPLADQFGNIRLNADGSQRIPACSTLIFDVTLLDAD